MDSKELRRLCERVFQLDKTGFTSDDRPWSWRDDTRLDDCSGNTLLQTDENKIKSVDNVKEIIVEYRDACPALARSCLALLDENAAMRGALAEIEKICDKPWGEMCARVWTIEDENYQAWHVRDIAHDTLAKLGERA